MGGIQGLSGMNACYSNTYIFQFLFFLCVYCLNVLWIFLGSNRYYTYSEFMSFMLVTGSK